MSDPELDGLSDSPSYVINIKWGLEGLVMPVVGVIGVLGNLNIYRDYIHHKSKIWGVE